MRGEEWGCGGVVGVGVDLGAHILSGVWEGGGRATEVASLSEKKGRRGEGGGAGGRGGRMEKTGE